MEDSLGTQHIEFNQAVGHLEDLVELALSEPRGAELRVQAPDTPQARAAFEAENLDRTRARVHVLETLVAPAQLFDPNEAEDDDDPDDDDPSDDRDDGEDSDGDEGEDDA